jgi:hypothetical protein
LIGYYKIRTSVKLMKKNILETNTIAKIIVKFLLNF